MLAAAIVAVVIVVGVYIAGSRLSKHFEPYIREQAIRYLEDRFEAEVKIEALRVQVPRLSAWQWWNTKGRGIMGHIEAEGIEVRQRARLSQPPLLAMKSFAFDIDLGTVMDPTKRIALVKLDQVNLNIPPTGDRPKILPAKKSSPQEQPAPKQSKPSPVRIDVIDVNTAKLVILNRNPEKKPLVFDIHKLVLRSTGFDKPMNYDAQLTNPKPIGEVDSKGTFGPFQAGEPGNTPLGGTYSFSNADLGVFAGIAGILQSKGEFNGSLSSILAKGQASVPDFRLKMAGHPVPLYTNFEVLVDGTNGNTELRPVHARLGSTRFTTSGGIIKHEGDYRRTIDLDVNMPQGDLRDVLRLAMKGPPFMEGILALKANIGIPPLKGRVREKLTLDGTFRVNNGKFLKSTIQDQLDTLSRRGQGQPQSQEIDEVVSHMQGKFRMRNEVIHFSDLRFGVPGADVLLAGDYDLDHDTLDFHGALKLQAKVSQTMTGWKRWVLKPVDPFFSKNGAGTFLRIQVVGSAKHPKFGLDKGHEDHNERARTQ